ncbi:MAG: cation-efflux pump [Terriglobia bacterium]
MESTAEHAYEQREKKSVALGSVGAALFLVTLKAVVGVSTQSLGVLSEAAHSGLDLVAAGLTYFSVRISGKPADADHQYGHGKFENFAAFLETGLLLLTCAWIVWEVVGRLFYREVHVEPTVWAFGVMALSIVVDRFRARALGRVARKYASQALEADALHFRTDVWSSSVVLLGLGLVLAADQFQVAWLQAADPIAALGVAGIIIYISVRLGKRTVDVLLDAAPAGLRAAVEQAARGVEGVLSVDRVRTRRAGNRDFVDVTIAVSRALPFERVHAISDAVEAAVGRRIPNADVMVHMEPRAATRESLFDAIRAVAARHNLSVHGLSAHEMAPNVRGSGGARRLVVDLHLEVSPTLSLREAHALATRVEQEVRQELPEIDAINTHIEPHAASISAGDPLGELARALEVHFAELCREVAELRDLHELEVRRVEGHIVVSCHSVVDGALPVSRVHDLSTELELRIRERFPQLYRVVIHCEPPEER